ncbi:hypothetical protein EYV94_22790 [Puteibacter caeruleilacunae]|nr:hypothetical protein EYV94_22790 [Puteibacter caeruleilacunae]
MHTVASISVNKYLYNGKELNDEFFENYDYGAWYYDAEIGRWHTVNPLAEKFPHQSLYVYADNNSVRFIDYMGMNASTLVTENQDGTCTVVGGDANDGAKTKFNINIEEVLIRMGNLVLQGILEILLLELWQAEQMLHGS